MTVYANFTNNQEEVPTKKALKAMVGTNKVSLVDQSIFDGGPVTDGHCVVSGPQYPKPHRWHAEVEIRKGRIVSVK